ncbi:MAG: hypothetical protein L0219_20660 [Phycisphaerales bacterium]|nr:hypothetical protein [Phycisphaerales bacterium]
MKSIFSRNTMAVGAVGTLLALATPAEPHPCPDLNGDQIVGIEDLLAVIAGWGACPAEPEPCPANVSDSGPGSDIVNIEDLLDVIEHWGACQL